MASGDDSHPGAVVLPRLLFTAFAVLALSDPAAPTERVDLVGEVARMACTRGAPRAASFDGALLRRAQGAFSANRLEEASWWVACMTRDGQFEVRRRLLLGQIATQEGRHDAAVPELTAALDARDREGRRGTLIPSIALGLAESGWRVGRFGTAVMHAILAEWTGRVLGQPEIGVRAAVARASALRRLGLTDEAEAVLGAVVAGTADARREDPRFCGGVWALFYLGVAQSEARVDQAMACTTLDEARDRVQPDAPCASQAGLRVAIELNRANCRVDADPDAAATILDDLPARKQQSFEAGLLRARIAIAREDADAATRHLDALTNLEFPDVSFEVEAEVVRGQADELAGRDDAAEAHYHRAIERAADLAAHTGADANATALRAPHRDAADRLFALFARQGRAAAAFAALLERTALVPAYAARPPLPAPLLALAATAAWRGRPLAVVVAPPPSGDRSQAVHRLTLVDGDLRVEEVGTARDVAAWVVALRAHPDDPATRAAARALGRVIVPPDAGVGTLDVLLIGTVGEVPLAALRGDDDHLVIEHRPLARVFTVWPQPPPPPPTGPALVLSDPTGDGRGMVQERLLVAARLPHGTRQAGDVWTGRPATLEELAAARGAAVIHVAAHFDPTASSRTLRLVDADGQPRAITGTDIIGLHLDAGLVFLSGCASGASRDPEGYASVAAAFLASGARAVIATDRSIEDLTSSAIAERFYAQPDWATDPPAALARVQVELAATAPATPWYAFQVFRGPPAPAAGPSW